MKSKKEPKFWKGDSIKGFVYGAVFGFAIGFANMAWLHIWHLGIIVWIAIWLFIGMNPRFKDNRTPEQIEADADKAKKKRAERIASQQQKKAVESSFTPQKESVTVEEPKKPSHHALRKIPHCPKCKSTDIQILDNKRKFSLIKTAAGGFVFGAAGAAVGAFTGKKGKKYKAVCLNCGKEFTIKL